MQLAFSAAAPRSGYFGCLVPFLIIACLHSTLCAQSGPPLSREYIRLGRRVIAIDNSGAPTLSSGTYSFTSSGGSGSVAIVGGATATWVAAKELTDSTTEWLTLNPPTTGTFPAEKTISFTAAANATSTPRSARLKVTFGAYPELFLTVTQEGLTISVIPSDITLNANSSSGSFTVTANSDWSPYSLNPDWLSVGGPARGRAAVAETVTYTAADNQSTSTERLGYIKFKVYGTQTDLPGQFQVRQSGVTTSTGACSVTPGISRSPIEHLDVPGYATGGSFQVYSSTGWTATSNAPNWISIPSGASGGVTPANGSTVTYSVTANTGSVSRTGTISLRPNCTSTLVVNFTITQTVMSVRLGPGAVLLSSGQAQKFTPFINSVAWDPNEFTWAVSGEGRIDPPQSGWYYAPEFSQPPATATVTATLNSNQQITASATVSFTADPKPPKLNPVSPANTGGTGAVFIHSITNDSGFAAIGQTQLTFAATNTTAASACWLVFYPIAGYAYLVNDQGGAFVQAIGTAGAPPTLGGAGILENSQCRLDLPTPSGYGGFYKDLSVQTNVSFKGSFAGTKNIYLFAANSQLPSDQQVMGWYNIITPSNRSPQTLSVTSNVSAGTSATFTAKFTDEDGATNLRTTEFLMHTTPSSLQACNIKYERDTNGFYLRADDGGVWSGPYTPGTNFTVKNSQCQLSGPGSSATFDAVRRELTLVLPVSFEILFAGGKTIWLSAWDGVAGTSYHPLNSFTVLAPAVAPSVASLSPASETSATGITRTFTAVYSDPNGHADISTAHLLFNGAPKSSGACWVMYNSGDNTVSLTNDAGDGFLDPLYPGSGMRENNFCKIYGLGLTVGRDRTDLTLNLPIEFKPAMAGTLNVYMIASDAAGLYSGDDWTFKGTWTIAGNVAPVIAGVVPADGNASTAGLTFAYSDANGYRNIDIAAFLIGPAFDGANSCFVLYSVPDNLWYLANDPYTEWLGPQIAGNGQPLENNQCRVSGLTAALSGNTITLNAAVAFTSAFAGPKYVLEYVEDKGHAAGGWRPTGTWTVAVPPASAWHNAAWAYRKPITIDRTKVSGGSALGGFPLLFSTIDPNLRFVDNGGGVGTPTGIDILFTQTDGAKLNHEIESYNAVTGELVAWVNLPALSPSADTTIYLYYGNPSSGDQQNPAEVWGTAHKGVWHLLTAADSTQYANGGLEGEAATATGKIGSAAAFNGTSSYISVGPSASLGLTGAITISAWVKPEVFPSAHHTFVEKGYNGTNEPYFLRLIADGAGGHLLEIGSFNGADHKASWLVSGWSVGEWRYVTGVYDGTTWRVYFDGGQKATQADTTGALSTGNTAPTVLGAASISGTIQRHFQGSLDEVRVLNVARSADWIATEFKNQSSPSTFYAVGAQAARP